VEWIWRGLLEKKQTLGNSHGRNATRISMSKFSQPFQKSLTYQSLFCAAKVEILSSTDSRIIGCF
jgi:hypothetical protein